MNDKKKLNKIPYDEEPIFRETNYQKSRKVKSPAAPVGFNKFLLVLVCILILFNIIFASVAVSKSKKTGDTINVYQDIYPESFNTQAVVSKAYDSVVMVHSELAKNADKNNVTEQSFNNMQMKGAGVIISDDKSTGEAYILTCYHVIRPNVDEVYIELSDCKTPIKATYVSFSLTYDMAVLKIQSEIYKKSAALPCEVADGTSIALGDGTVAIGNPLGRGLSPTSGIVSHLFEPIEVQNSPASHIVFRTSAPINAGNSGGGLFNEEGKLIGIVSVKTGDSSSGSVDCVAYAINSTLAINFAYNVIRNNSPRLAYIGLEFKIEDNSITEYDYIDNRRVPYESVVVKSIAEDSPLSGKISAGDKVVGFTYRDKVVKFRNIYSFENYAFDINVGDEVELLLESGKSVKFKIEKTILAS